MVADPEPGHERFIGRLAIPYLTATGVVSLKFRCLEHEDCKANDCVKYLCLNGEEGTPRLYNVEAFFEESPWIVVLEGELDAGVMHYEIGVPAVGAPGASSWQPHWSRCFAGYERVFCLTDGDPSGQNFGKKVAKELPYQATVIPFPQGHDTNSLYVAEGAAAVRRLLGLSE